jgi:5'-3' exonuclease
VHPQGSATWIYRPTRERTKSKTTVDNECRFEKRTDATEALATAQEAGEAADIEKYSKRTVRVSRQQNEDCRKLLRLMGVPVVEAPAEAEAECANLCKLGKVRHDGFRIWVYSRVGIWGHSRFGIWVSQRV